MAREFISRFEEDETVILERELDRIGDEWRKEPGDYIHDTVAATPLEVKQLQVNQDEILRAAFAQTAEEEDLDEHLYHVGLRRMEATPNKRRLLVEADAGVVIPEGYEASTVVLDGEGDPLEFTVDQVVQFGEAGVLAVDITCTTTGAVTNLMAGASIIFIPPIPGIREITDLGTTITARDREDDESALARYDYKLQYPDTGGNKHDYVRWSSEIPGVGKIRVVSRWQNQLKVKIVVVDDNFEPATPELVSDLQDYLDPGSQGLGEGKAPAGSQVYVFAANALPINITADVVYIEGVDPALIRQNFIIACAKYLRSLVFASNVIGYNKIGALLGTQAEVVNYSNLRINGAAEDIEVTDDDAPMLGTVTI